MTRQEAQDRRSALWAELVDQGKTEDARRAYMAACLADYMAGHLSRTEFLSRKASAARVGNAGAWSPPR